MSSLILSHKARDLELNHSAFVCKQTTLWKWNVNTYREDYEIRGTHENAIIVMKLRIENDEKINHTSLRHRTNW